jgi:hypothetical protein
VYDNDDDNNKKKKQKSRNFGRLNKRQKLLRASSLHLGYPTGASK